MHRSQLPLPNPDLPKPDPASRIAFAVTLFYFCTSSSMDPPFIQKDRQSRPIWTRILLQFGSRSGPPPSPLAARRERREQPSNTSGLRCPAATWASFLVPGPGSNQRRSHTARSIDIEKVPHVCCGGCDIGLRFGAATAASIFHMGYVHGLGPRLSIRVSTKPLCFLLFILSIVSVDRLCTLPRLPSRVI